MRDERLPSWISFESSKGVTPHCGIQARATSSPQNFSLPGGGITKRRHEQPSSALEVAISYRESRLLTLCRHHRWKEVKERVTSFPHEAEPQPHSYVQDKASLSPQIQKRSHNKDIRSKEHLLQEKGETFCMTALGILCNSVCQHELVSNEEEYRQAFEVLIQKCPLQIRSSQFTLGNTPLRAAIANKYCSAGMIRFMLERDQSLESDLQPAVCQRDEDGMYPLDHAIKAFHIDSRTEILDIMDAIVEYTGAVMTSCAPLVRLFSLGGSFGFLRSPEAHPSHFPQIDQSHVQRLLLCTRFLIKKYPLLIYQFSGTTGCSPLHVALRNYGNVPELIRELVERDTDALTLRHRNNYGDLAIHVACSVGVPIDVLQFVLVRTLECEKSSHPHCLIWSTNGTGGYGYTPVDLEWIRHIEEGKGFYSHRNFYPLDSPGIQRPEGRCSELYNSLLRKSVDEVIKSPTSSHISRDAEARKAFGLLLDRIFIIIRLAFKGTFFRLPFDISDDILHHACALCGPSGPVLPLPILELIIWQYPEQVVQPDHQGRLPLHYAVQQRDLTFYDDDVGTNWKNWVKILVQQAPLSCSTADKAGRLPLHYALHETSVSDEKKVKSLSARDEVVNLIVGKYPEALGIRDSLTGLFPFMAASSSRQVSLDTSYTLLRKSPPFC